MKVLYALSAMFPSGRAYATRALNICKALIKAGNEVDVIADYISNKELLVGNNIAKYGLINIFLSTKHEAKKRTLVDKFFAPFKSTKTIKHYLNQQKPDCIILSSSHDRFKSWLKIVKKYDIPIILESCEWFDFYNFKFGHLNPMFAKFVRCWNKYFTQVNGVIAISKTIQNHYLSLNIPTIRIPGLCDPGRMSFNNSRKEDSKINVVFAGDVYKGKDDIAIFAKTIQSPPFNRDVVFHIFGVSAKYVKSLFNKSIPNNIKTYGFVDQNILFSKMKNMDYGLIIRPDRRSSHAGFPTKLVDYMSLGLPVIANLTGDIGMFLKDGYNGFVLPDARESSIRNVLLRIKAQIKEHDLQRINAYSCAKNNFAFDLYSNPLHSFINEVCLLYKK